MTAYSWSYVVILYEQFYNIEINVVYLFNSDYSVVFFDT